LHQSGKFGVSYGDSVTIPGPVKQVPIKVVPMYIEDAPAEIPVEEDAPLQPEREKTPLLGAIAMTAAVLTGALHAVAVALASNGVYQTSTVLAITAIGLSIVAIVMGVIAAILDRGRRLGVVAAVLGLIVNPFVVLLTLRFFSAFVAV
jgi:lysylphosphatidylglycerol synthetase-like protein (DUF2156 family)